jgi:hypothetical protein
MDFRSYLDTLRVLHGLFNTGVMGLFLYQGWLGLKIRKARKTGGSRDLNLIRRHRKGGPIYTALGLLGFLAGLILVLIDQGRIMAFPLHLFVGLFLLLLIGLTYWLGQKIKGMESPPRTRHFFIGIILVGFYILQVLIGLDVLF